MVSVSGAEVSSKALIELQANLISLSKELKELYDILCNNMSALSEDWRDEKFSEFEEGFRPSKELILELSEKYAQWANQYLPPRIEATIEIENSSVTLDGSSSAADVSAPNAGVSSAEAGILSSNKRSVSTEGKAAAFKRGIEKLNNMKPKPKPIPPGDSGFGQNERERIWQMINQKTR